MRTVGNATESGCSTGACSDPSDKVEGRRIGPNGILRLLNDLGVDPASREVLILAWKLKAGTQCEFSWDEWKDGMTALK